MGQAGGARDRDSNGFFGVRDWWAVFIGVQYPVLVIHPLTMYESDELLIFKYLILQLSQLGIPIWRAWVCRDTRTACRWFQIRALAAPAPGADCLPVRGPSSESDESEAWWSAWWRGRGCAGPEAGRASGLWWSEAPEGSLEGRRRWLRGTQTYNNASMRTPTRERTHTIDREEEEKTNRLFNRRNRGIVHIYSGVLYRDPSFVTHQPSSTC